METFFNIRYEFDKNQVHDAIATRLGQTGSDYICVSDGVILNKVCRDLEYRKTINSGMFSICDSSYVPLYLRWIYGIRRKQYCGSQIFKDIVVSRKYRMIFLGTNKKILSGLQTKLNIINPDIINMQFIELPFLSVEDFDYESIAKLIHDDESDIVWIALGAPKQEKFMERLKPYLNHGIMIAVGAAFKFFSGTDVKRAPEWMIKYHVEFIHRIMVEPKKQIKRCLGIVTSLPKLLLTEYIRSIKSNSHPQIDL